MRLLHVSQLLAAHVNWYRRSSRGANFTYMVQYSCSPHTFSSIIKWIQIVWCTYNNEPWNIEYERHVLLYHSLFQEFMMTGIIPSEREVVRRVQVDSGNTTAIFTGDAAHGGISHMPDKQQADAVECFRERSIRTAYGGAHNQGNDGYSWPVCGCGKGKRFDNTNHPNCGKCAECRRCGKDCSINFPTCHPCYLLEKEAKAKLLTGRCTVCHKAISPKYRTCWDHQTWVRFQCIL